MYKPQVTHVKIQLDPKYFPLPLDCRWLDGKRWRLLSPFEYHCSDTNDIIRAEKDFITDFGSKPWWTWSLIGCPTDEGGPAYIPHDWMCRHATWGRAKTDRIFLYAMRDCGMAYLKRMTQYLAVRLASYFS